MAQQELDESFDAFYRSTRRRLLRETLALTGDPHVAQGAVRDAYSSAWHRWRRLSRLDDPLGWVRPRAWREAQRRHPTRPLHPSRRPAPEQRRVLQALAQLPLERRRLLVAVDVAGLDLSAAVAELGLAPGTDQERLDRARRTFVVALSDNESAPHGSSAGAAGDPTAPRATGVLDEMLDGMLDGVTLPRGSRLRRWDRSRRQARVLLTAAAASLVAVGAGTLLHEPTGSAQQVGPSPTATQEAASKELPTGDDLLDAAQVRWLAPRRTWRTTSTTNNTSGDGINSRCQRSRFADPHGYAALVRTFRTSRGAASAVQTVEASRSTGRARRSFDTTVGWYAGCQAARVQLLRAYRVRGVGGEATLLVLRSWRRPLTTISVGIARTGSVVTSTVATTRGTSTPPPRRLTTALATAVSSLCTGTGRPGCVHRPRTRAVPPPPSGEGRGLLAVADLPPVGGIDKPWAGTTPVSPRSNPGSTSCDEAAFASAGARRRRSRTFLVPQAHLPARFGLTETYGWFGSQSTATRFLAGVRSRFASCEKRDLAVKVGSSRTWHAEGADLSRWDLTLAVSEHDKVRMRIAFVRVGDRVAQLTFVPTTGDDVAPRAFEALMVRAGDRLREL